MKKYWYKFYVGECPVCGRNASYKERIYGEKPKNIQDRYIILAQEQTYDHCLER